MRLLVTGAKGMLGHRVAEHGRERGHEVHVTDLPELDLTDAQAVFDHVGESGAASMLCTRSRRTRQPSSPSSSSSDKRTPQSSQSSSASGTTNARHSRRCASKAKLHSRHWPTPNRTTAPGWTDAHRKC